MSSRLKHYIKQGLLERYSCLLNRPGRVLWLQCDPGDNEIPGVEVTTLAINELDRFKVSAAYEAVLIEAACLDVTKLPQIVHSLHPYLADGALFYYAFYALDSAKEYLNTLTAYGVPAMQPFLDMHDVADIVMAEQIMDVVSDNEVFQLPQLSRDEWALELERAQLLPAIQAFCQSHAIDLPDLKNMPSECFLKTTIELGFVHGVYQLTSREVKPGVHAVPVSQIGGLKKAK